MCTASHLPTQTVCVSSRHLDTLCSVPPQSIYFGLPDERCRQLILKQYAQQLSDAERGLLAARSGGLSGRDLRDVCEHTERRWASKVSWVMVPWW